ncbi:mechanosensitive ion channel family protein, partial [Methylobacterium sp. sgz302003]
PPPTSLPRDLRALEVAADDTVMQVRRNASPLTLLAVALAIGVSVALYVGRRHIAPRFGRRDAARDLAKEPGKDAAKAPPKAPSRREKVLAAWRVVLAGAVPAILGSFVVGLAIEASELVPERFTVVVHGILGALAFVAVVEAVTDALLSPDRPNWRLVAMEDATAERLTRLAIAIAVVITVGRTVEELNDSLSLALPISIITRGLFALVVAVVLAEGLRRFAARAETEEACLGPYVAAESNTSTIGGPLRILGWVVAGAVALCALAGYIALSSFLIDQLLWTAVGAALLYLAIVSADAFIGGVLQDDSRVATALQANTGLRKRSLNQIAVLMAGLVRVVLITTAAVLLLATWGVESTDIYASFRAAFFGFKVGDVTVSLSTIVFALGLFVLGLLVARTVKRWLENTYLPATDLDPGLRNSIATVTGYVGFLISLTVAFSFLGLSLEKITIVAGALSVGIGFGLQSIVNNFVSGLLLLWERPIRVGDLVVIGDNEGYVRRISVRSTEIQTFDRSAVIVPNSNLISGVVKNRVRGDRTGRVAITVSVLRNQDPVKAADLIVGCARAHPDVLREPPPRVVFRKIGDPFLEFELIAMILDVGQQLKVQSDLNFAVFKTLSEAGLIPNLGPGASIVTVQGLEPMQEALGQIARGVLPTSGAPGEPAPRPAGDERRRTRETVP